MSEVSRKTVSISTDAQARAALKLKGAHRVRPPRGGMDIPGLYLRVQRVGSGAWALRASLFGKMTWIGLGRFPDINLSDARSIAQEKRTVIAKGGDPRKQAASEIITWAIACQRCYEHEQAKWSNTKAARQFISTLTTYTEPAIGQIPVEHVGPDHIATAIRPIWKSKHETARRTLQRCGVVLRWASSQGLYTRTESVDRTMEQVRALLGPVSREAKTAKHHLALPYGETPRVIAALRASGANPITKLLAEFTILTAARSGEARNATWAQIDTEALTWTLSPETMKARREHVVPLSGRAFEVLEAARMLSDGSNLIFPGAKHGTPISDATVRKLLNTTPAIRKMIDAAHPPTIAPDGSAAPQKLTIHGFRSSFRDWCGATGIDRQLSELSLAHAIGDATEAAYARDTLVERRRAVMESWADFIETGHGKTAKVMAMQG